MVSSTEERHTVQAGSEAGIPTATNLGIWWGGSQASLNSAVLVDVNTFGAGADRSAIMNRDRTQCLSNEW